MIVMIRIIVARERSKVGLLYSTNQESKPSTVTNLQLPFERRDYTAFLEEEPWIERIHVGLAAVFGKRMHSIFEAILQQDCCVVRYSFQKVSMSAVCTSGRWWKEHR